LNLEVENSQRLEELNESELLCGVHSHKTFQRNSLNSLPPCLQFPVLTTFSVVVVVVVVAFDVMMMDHLFSFLTWETIVIGALVILILYKCVLKDLFAPAR
jgi:uncharacterized membrane protein